MLICNVSALRPPRGITVAITEASAANATAIGHIAGIAVAMAEEAEAVDAASTGLILATLVDDPASASAIVDAFRGQIMGEAASATDVLTPSSSFTSDINEVLTAASAQDATKLGAVTTRSTMLPGMFVNSDTSREAYVDGVMVNQ